MSYQQKAMIEGRFGRKATTYATGDTPTEEINVRGVVMLEAGDLSILTEGGSNVEFAGAPCGFIPPYRVRQVLSVSTAVATIED